MNSDVAIQGVEQDRKQTILFTDRKLFDIACKTKPEEANKLFLLTQDWMLSVENGFYNYIVNSLTDMKKIKDYCKQRGYPCDVKYAIVEKRLEYDFCLSVIKHKEIVTFTEDEIIRSVMVVNENTYRKLRKCTDNIHGYPYLYGSIEDVIEYGIKRLACTYEDTGRILKCINKNIDNSCNIDLFIISFHDQHDSQLRYTASSIVLVIRG